MRFCRPLKVPIKNSLLALSGSMLDVQASGEDVASDQVAFELNQVSAFTRDPAFSLRSSAKNGKGLGKSKIDAHQCLFAPLERPSRPLVSLEAPDVSVEDQLKDYVQWKGDQNCFPGFSRLLEFQRPNQTDVMMQLDAKRWENLFKEMNMRTDELSFPSRGDAPLWQALPAEFRPMDPPSEFIDMGIGVAAKEMDALAKSLK